MRKKVLKESLKNQILKRVKRKRYSTENLVLKKLGGDILRNIG